MEELAAGIEGDGVDRLVADWRASGRPMIVVAGHVGNNEAVAAALAGRGLPRQRRRGRLLLPGALRAPPPRSARPGASTSSRGATCASCSRVLERKEILALLVDWGYRSDGIPVQLFGAWTTLPAGPATLAAKTRRDHRAAGDPADRRTAGSRIEPHGDVHRAVVGPGGPPAGDPADRGRPRGDRSPPAPEQWYSFKPDVAGRPGRGPRPRGPGGGELAWPAAGIRRRGGGRLRRTGAAATVTAPAGACAARRTSGRSRGSLAAWPAAARRGAPAGGARWSRPPSPSASCGTGSRPRRRRPGARQPAPVSARAWPRAAAVPAAARRAAPDPDALERLVRASFRHAARYYLEVARAGAYDIEHGARPRRPRRRPTRSARRCQSGNPVDHRGHALRRHRAARRPAVAPASATASRRRWRPSTDPALQRWFVSSRSRVGVNIVPIENARRRSLRGAAQRASPSAWSPTATSPTGIDVPFFGHPAPIPAGPALLALETGATIYVSAARRIRDGRYAGTPDPRPDAGTGTRRERMVALTAAIAVGLRVDPRRRARAVVGRLPPDLAGPGPVGADAAGRGRAPAASP